MEHEPLPFGPWWDVYRRLVASDGFPVVPAAMAMSHILQGGHPWPEADARLRQLEAAARDRALPVPAEGAQAIVGLLAEEGFGGDTDRYEDPANSLLDRVLQRRRGLPIALSVLAVHLAQHAGVPLRGVGFPGHFMVGLGFDEPEPLVLDPFSGGRVLAPAQLERLLARVSPGRPPPGSWRQFVRPASGRQILTRMLRNLVVHHTHADQPTHAQAAERLLQLTATPEPRSGAHQPD